MESLRQIAKVMAEQKRKLKQFLKEGIKKVPVSDEVLEKLVSIGGWEEHEIMSCHPGYDLERKIKSVQRALETYRRSHADLITRLDEFDAASKDGTLFDRPRTAELREHEEACRKEIFTLSCAAAALVALARRVTASITVPRFHEVRTKNFDEGQHKFITDLRVQLNHVTFFDSNWSINVNWSTKGTGPVQTSHFEFKAATLIRDGEFSGEAKAYIREQQDRIDIRNLFETYSKSVQNFYAWLVPEIEARLPAEVQDYRRCIRARRANQARFRYRILFAQVVKPETDLYGHLQKYLTPEELEEIDALPHRSKQQIDRVIEMIDEYGACDDELRGLVYKAFGLIM